MVKNYGGNKGKKVARKNLISPVSRVLREKNINEPCEIYACVIKLFGGANCEIIGEDGVIRNCVIRNKFRGRSKRDNFIGPNVWTLVGLREWEVKNKSKKEACDLLYVYTDEEKLLLKNKLNCGWRNFAAAFPDEDNEISEVGIDFIIEDNIQNEEIIREIEESVDNDENILTQSDDDIIDIDEI